MKIPGPFPRLLGGKAGDDDKRLSLKPVVLGALGLLGFVALLLPALRRLVQAARRKAPVRSESLKVAPPPSAPPVTPAGRPAHYEKTHLRGWPFVLGAICFFILMSMLFPTMWVVLQGWSHPWPLPGPPVGPGAQPQWQEQFPQVQINPNLDLERLRQAEYQRLHASRWTDPTHAYAVIPIEDAMRVLTDAAARNELTTVLPAPQPATPVQLQDQKSREVAPPQIPNP